MLSLYLYGIVVHIMLLRTVTTSEDKCQRPQKHMGEMVTRLTLVEI